MDGKFRETDTVITSDNAIRGRYTDSKKQLLDKTKKNKILIVWKF